MLYEVKASSHWRVAALVILAIDMKTSDSIGLIVHIPDTIVKAQCLCAAVPFPRAFCCAGDTVSKS